MYGSDPRFDFSPVGYADPRKGSFQFPDPGGFSGDVDEYLAFFQRAPIPEELLRRVDREYRTAYANAILKAKSDGIEYNWNKDPNAEKIILSTPSGQLVETTKRLRDETVNRFVNSADEEWSRRSSIHPLNLRALIRAVQAVRMRGILGDKAKMNEMFRTEVTWVDGGRSTYYEAFQEYRCGEWITQAL